MTMRAEQIEALAGVDTRRDTLAAAVLTSVGAVTAYADVAADGRGFQELLNFALSADNWRRQS